jgi:twitching motility two-component system response regulator PilG
MLFSQDENEEPEAQPFHYDRQIPPLPPVAEDLFDDQTRTILVVDSNPIIGNLIQRVLQKEQLRVIFANDTASGLASIEAYHPHLVLLSIQFARVDQYLLCRTIRKTRHLIRIPVIIFGMREDGTFDTMRGRLAGSTDFLSQPFKPHQIIQMIKKYLPA